MDDGREAAARKKSNWTGSCGSIAGIEKKIDDSQRQIKDKIQSVQFPHVIVGERIRVPREKIREKQRDNVTCLLQNPLEI